MRIISQRSDVWNTETGVVNQDRSSRTQQQLQQSQPQQSQPQPSKPSVSQLPDGTWKLVKDAPGKVGAKITQIWDKTKKNMIKQWESSASPVMASRNYRAIIKAKSLFKKSTTTEDDFRFVSPNVELTVFGAEGGIHRSKVSLNWLVYLDLRGWGVKSFHPSVPSQTISYTAEVEDPSGEDYISKDFSITIDDNAEVKYAEESNSGGVWPTEIEVHEGKTQITFTRP